MKFVDLSYENRLARINSRTRFHEIETSGHYLLGQQLEEFESRFSAHRGLRSCVGVKNATDALTLTFDVLCQRGFLTAVLPGFGAYPTVVAALNSGFDRVVIAPVDGSLCLDLSKIEVPKRSVIVPVFLYGNVPNMKSIRSIAGITDSVIVEDRAQATGVGLDFDSLAEIHSFYPTKPCGSMGDGGAIVSNDEDLCKSIRTASRYGMEDGLLVSRGCNSRMDEWQAAFLNEKLSLYEKMNEARRCHAKRYSSFDDSIEWHADCVFHQYVSLWDDNGTVVKELSKRGIPTMIHYPHMLRDMPLLKSSLVEFCDGDDRPCDHVVSLPVGPHLTQDNVDRVAGSIFELRTHLLSK